MSRRQITCDAVFEVLTRGPFPSGGPEDRAVERHLDVCHECMSLAEALRPAVAVLHESVTDLEARRLPRYDGPRGASRLERWFNAASEANRWGFTRSGVLAIAGLLSVVVALAAVVHWTAPPHLRSRSGLERSRAELSLEGRQFLVSLALQDRCAPKALNQLAGGGREGEATRDGLACCTECHGASRSRDLSGSAMRDIMLSCRACHQRS